MRVYEFDHFRLDAANHLLLRDGRPVPLPPKAFETLLALVENHGRVLEKDELMKRVWRDCVVEEATLAQNVFTLRKVLGESENGERYIRTVPKHGYWFVASVKELTGESAQLSIEKPAGVEEVREAEEAEGEISAQMNDEQRFEQKALQAGIEATRRTGSQLNRNILALAVLLAGLAAVFSYLWISSKSKQPDTPATVRSIAVLPSTVRSIAVLPFKPIGAESNDEYLGLGVTDALINKLGHIRQIIVRPTSAVSKYTATGQDPLAAGRELGVGSVLDGHIQRLGNRFRVTVHLMNVQDGASLWTEKFDVKETDIFSLQDSISDQVTRALALTLTGEEKRLLTKRYTENTEAYQAYLKGRFYWNKRTEAGYKKAIEHFQQAIELDPNYAQAYAGLADAYALLGSMGNSVMPRTEAMPRAKSAAMKALGLDESLADAHTSLAFVEMHYEWNWPLAEREFHRAIELNPNYATAHHWYAYDLIAMSRVDEAIAEIKRAQQSDPLSIIINTDVGEVFLFARQFDQAIEQSRKTLEMDQNFVLAHQVLGEAYAQKRRYAESITVLKTAVAISGRRTRTLALLGYVYGVSGRKGEAENVLDELIRFSKQKYIDPGEIALAYAGLGEKDQAFVWLEKAYQERSGALILLKVEPAFDSLRADPRFRDLMRRVGLAP